MISKPTGRKTQMSEFDHYLDVKGMLCPLPVLKARKRLQGLACGEVLKVDATDPAAVIDFPHFCNESGHELVEQSDHQGTYSFWIKRT
jgi:tRNA 2-thiouridine synthesizing protein A